MPRLTLLAFLTLGIFPFASSAQNPLADERGYIVQEQPLRLVY